MPRSEACAKRGSRDAAPRRGRGALSRDRDGRLRALLERLATIGGSPDDTEDLRVRKVTLVAGVITVTLLAVIWVAVYAALGLYVSALIPLAYQVVTIGTLAWFARTRRFEAVRFSQVALMLALPFLLQWSLGGYAESSAVSLWGIVAALGALLFYGARGAGVWFIAFVALTIVSGVIDASLPPASIAEPVRTLFFVLNTLGVSIVAFLLLQYFVRAREREFERSELLLLNILPRPIAERLKRDGRVIAQAHPDVTVVFADVVDFTPLAVRTPPDQLVGMLDTIFTSFDDVADWRGLEKIKTIGDAYMAASGLPVARPDHAEAAAEFAMDLDAEFQRVCVDLGVALQLRIGMATGPVVAGVIGRRKFIYDLWGDTVNLASRMESAGVPGRIQVTEATRARLADRYVFEPRGLIEVKGKGQLSTYLLVGRQTGEQAPAIEAPEAAVVGSRG